MRMDEDVASAKKRKSGIPTGNAGEYFVMGELLRRGYEAQLADRNTKGYDLLVGLPGDRFMTKVQVKSVRQQPWFVRVSDFEGSKCDQFTIYVLLGPETPVKPVRFFIARNRSLLDKFHHPDEWRAQGKDSAFMKLRDLEPFAENWDALKTADNSN
jgi:hypothetical protein